MNFLTLALAALLSGWLGLAITGRIARGYPVLKEGASVQVGKETLTIEELGIRYQPLIYMQAETHSPPPVAMWYEVVDNLEAWDLVYHPEWENEIHPNPWLHLLYSLFRAPMYGFPLRDVEYIQVSVDKGSGHISRIRHETSPQTSFDQTLSEHWLVYIDCSNDGCYQVVTDTQGKITIPETEISLELVSDRQLRMGVATWNHLLTRLDDTESYSQVVPFELSYLDDDTYKRHKFTRKSQGDWATQESVLPRVLAILASFGAILTLGSFTQRAKTRKR